MSKTFTLKRIRLINFHNFVNETISVNGHLFLIGGNGSGKTTVLDAVHFVLTAGRNMELNSAARMAGQPRRLGRKIQGIFLRYDLEKGARNAANTIGYAVLEFENPDGKKNCIGCGALAISMESVPDIWGFESSGSLDDIGLFRQENDGLYPLNQQELTAKGQCRVYNRDRYISVISEKFFASTSAYRDTMNLIAAGKSYRELVSRFQDQSELFRELLPPPDAEDYQRIRDSLKDIDKIQQQLEDQKTLIAALRNVQIQRDSALEQREKEARINYLLAVHNLDKAKKFCDNQQDLLKKNEAELQILKEKLKENLLERQKSEIELGGLKNSDAFKNSALLNNLETQLHERQNNCSNQKVRFEEAIALLKKQAADKDQLWLNIEDYWQQLESCYLKFQNYCNFEAAFDKDNFAKDLKVYYRSWIEKLKLKRSELVNLIGELKIRIEAIEKDTKILEKRILQMRNQKEAVPPATGYQELAELLNQEKIEYVPFYRLIEPTDQLSDGFARVIEELIGSENLCAVFAIGSSQSRARAAVLAKPYNIPVIDCSPGRPQISASPPSGIRHLLDFDDRFEHAAERFATELLDRYHYCDSDKAFEKSDHRFCVSRGGLIRQQSAVRKVCCEVNRFIGSAARKRAQLQEIEDLEIEINGKNQQIIELRTARDAEISRQKKIDQDFEDINYFHPDRLLGFETKLLETDEKMKLSRLKIEQLATEIAGLELKISANENEIEVCKKALSGLNIEKDRVRIAELEELCRRLEKESVELNRRLGSCEEKQLKIAGDIQFAQQQEGRCLSVLRLARKELQKLKPELEDGQIHKYVFITKGGQQFKPENLEYNLHEAGREFARMHERLKNTLLNDTMLQKNYGFTLDDETFAVTSSGRSLNEITLEREVESEKTGEILNKKNRVLFEELIINHIVRKLSKEEEALNTTIKSMNRLLSDLKFGNTVYHFSMNLRKEFKEFRELVRQYADYKTESKENLQQFFEFHKRELIQEGAELPDFLDYRKWHDIVLTAKTISENAGSANEKGVTLSRRVLSLGSGGEQSVPNYILLLSLARVHLEHTGSKIRILLMDEAFYGIDAQRRDELLGFADSLGLNLVVAHPDLDGVTDKLERTTTLLVEKTAAGDVYVGEYVFSRKKPAGLFDEAPEEPSAEIRNQLNERFNQKNLKSQTHCVVLLKICSTEIDRTGNIPGFFRILSPAVAEEA
jgi:energy-coupling factor transporter ATP-binding protein EcfA2